jgi:hypothetical protein
VSFLGLHAISGLADSEASKDQQWLKLGQQNWKQVYAEEVLWFWTSLLFGASAWRVSFFFWSVFPFGPPRTLGIPLLLWQKDSI